MIEYIGKCLLIEEKGEKIVVIGDLHLGYEEALNKSGVYVTREMYGEMKEELEEVFNVICNKSNKGLGDGSVERLNGKSDNLVGIKNNIVSSKSEVLRVTNKNKLDKINKVSERDSYGMDGNKKVVDKIILLGDVKHSFSGNLKQEWNDVLGVINYLKGKCNELVILRGNHDNYLINIANTRNVKVVESYIWNEYCFVHGDVEREEMKDKKIKYWIMGHAHPAVFISDGNKREKYKCFLVGDYKKKKVVIVPSFFSLVVGSDISNGLNVPWKFNVDKCEVKIVNGLEVFDFGKLKDIV